MSAHSRIRFLLPLFLCLLLPLESAGAGDAASRSITDMRGKSITIPVDIQRVATIDDGFVEGIMTHLGVIDTVAAIGSWSMKRDYRYQFTTSSGEGYEHRGWNTMKFLHPWLDDLPCVNSPQGNVIDFEALAAVNPDVVILRLGDCTLSGGDREAADRTMGTIEALGLPLVVTCAPGVGGGDVWDLSPLREEMGLVGDVFNQKEKALELADMLAATEALIRERTASVPPAEKARLLYFSLDPSTRSQGGSGLVTGTGTPESHIIESIAGAHNAYEGRGSRIPLSAEQVYALDPDVIVLPTFNGYHPPRELMESPYYENLRELRAVKEKRVYAMPWTPMNCARRLEYPIDMLIIAKAAYPDRFQDISVHGFALALYKKLYSVNDETAKGLATTQLLDWMLESGF